MKKIPLPVMKCDDGCGECCGPVMCKGYEYQRVLKYAADHGIEPVSQGEVCPFYQGGQCQVYEARPFVCSFFGHTERLTCCKGYNVNVPAIVEKRLLRQYGIKKNKDDVRFLHEALGEGWEQVIIRHLKVLAKEQDHVESHATSPGHSS